MLTCDTCGDPIEKISEGWLEWLAEGRGSSNERYYGFHITHQPKCHKYDDWDELPKRARRQDNHLHYFTGERGLASLLALAARGADRFEIVRVIARLHLAGFENEYNNDEDEEPETYAYLIDILKILS